MAKIKMLFILIFLFISASYSWAATSYTATTCSRTDVQTAITSCLGDAECTTVNIPAGQCSWDGSSITTINLNGGSLEIIGAGSGADSASNTILTLDLGITDYFSVSNGTWFRASNIRFLTNAEGANTCDSNPCSATVFNLATLQNWRIDHNHIEGYQTEVAFKSLTKGLIDQNTIIALGTSGDYYGIAAGMPYDGKPSDICNTEVCTCYGGDESINRASSIGSGNTFIAVNPVTIDNSGGTGIGTVQRIYFNVASANEGATARFVSLSNVAGNSFTARARSEALSVKAGLNIFTVDESDFTAFGVHNGDYIGAYLDGCAAEAATGSTSWVISGDQSQGVGVDFGSPSMGTTSLWVEVFDDEGDYAACEAEWDAWWDNTSRGGGYYLGFNEGWLYDEKAVYVEGNTMTDTRTSIEGNWGSGSAWVVRYNNMINPSGQVQTGLKPGGQYQIFNNNEISYSGVNPPDGYFFRLRGQGALIYKNRFTDVSYLGIWAAARNYSGSYYFPFQTRPKDVFIYDNTSIRIGCGDPDSEDCWSIENEHDEYLNGPGENGPIRFSAPPTGHRLYNFTEYQCPHPLTGLPEGCDDTQYGTAGYDTGSEETPTPSTMSGVTIKAGVSLTP